ncbi:MAG: response regulator [Deltaproteobacteria bacterium]|jgi:CheY-like chemotaxis protein|nr:response regulator [Deltaproteobacteria bacterium]
MSATIFFQIQDQTLIEKLKGFLEGEKYQVLTPKAPVEGEEDALPITRITQAILKQKPDIVVMDYNHEDEQSVKVMQAVTDEYPNTSFIFIDSVEPADRENVVLAFNEGVKGFLLQDTTKTLFINTLQRAHSGPSRTRTGEDTQSLEQELQDQGQRLGKLKIQLNSAQKLVNYLLTTPVSTQPRKILVLSDSGYQREILKKLLEDFNFVVVTATSIEEAVPLTLKEKPRIVLSDYTLEDGKTGVDFCKELKYNQKFTPCYFVVCTASEDKLPLVMAPGNGVDDCLLKPASDSATAEFITRIALGLIL